MPRSKRCGIPANGGMIGYAKCDHEWGHDGLMHANAGDGFYSRDTEAEHKRRQKARRAAPNGGPADV